jgi:hypothetical protein
MSVNYTAQQGCPRPAHTADRDSSSGSRAFPEAATWAHPMYHTVHEPRRLLILAMAGMRSNHCGLFGTIKPRAINVLHRPPADANI